jgi:hypothetical protein
MPFPVVHDLRAALLADYSVIAAISAAPASNILRLEGNVTN